MMRGVLALLKKNFIGYIFLSYRRDINCIRMLSNIDGQRAPIRDKIKKLMI